MSKNYNVIVIGAGPAGYTAAIRCAQLGFSVACIDKSIDGDGEASLGGTCLNWGCIPSKALLDISHSYIHAQELGEVGIDIGQEPTIDVQRMMTHKSEVVSKLTGGVQLLFEANGVTSLAGSGKLLSGKRVELTLHDGTVEELIGEHIILAPGSVPIELPIAPIDGERIVDSTGALEFDEVPQRLGIIGAGVIGLELGSVWGRLGSEVVTLEALEEFLPMTDQRIAREAKRIFDKQGLDIRLGCRVTSAEVKGDTVCVNYLIGEAEHSLECDKLIVAVGRRPYTDGLLVDDCGVNFDERGFIFVNDLCQTGAPEIYAVGDAVRGPMLAHKGMEEGVMVAERIAGQKPLVNYETVPSVIYTHPEVAWVGLSEQAMKANGEGVRTGMFSFGANGRALAARDSEGFVKVVADADSDRLRGVHVLGPQASELIAEAVIAMEFGGTAEDLGLTMFAHPTLSEAMHEASLAVAGHAIHAVNRRSRK